MHGGIIRLMEEIWIQSKLFWLTNWLDSKGACTKPEDLSLIPGTLRMEGERRLANCPLTSAHVPRHVCIYTIHTCVAAILYMVSYLKLSLHLIFNQH